MATTLFQSFSASLPTFQNINPTAHLDASENVTAATGINAPKFATKAAGYYLIGKTIISAAHVQTLLQSLYLAPVDPTTTHFSTADVFRSASVYLLHPVNIALSAYQPGGVRCMSETSASNTRIDALYLAGSPDRVFAVLEFKRRDVLKVNEFKLATKTATTDAQVQALVQTASNRPGASFFAGNALKIIKQAARYAIQHGTQYVALFDWGFLIMIRFVDLDVTQDDDTRVANGVGTRCTIDMVSLLHSMKMRASLLGFLSEAYDNTP